MDLRDAMTCSGEGALKMAVPATMTLLPDEMEKKTGQGMRVSE